MATIFSLRRACLRIRTPSLLRVQYQRHCVSSQASAAPRENVGLDHRDETEEMINLLQGKEIEWSHPGVAQYDFRSKSPNSLQ